MPCSPVNTIDQVFADPQVRHRGMRIEMEHPLAAGAPAPLVACPTKLSATPPTYRRPPPLLGEHTDEILSEVLGLDSAEIADLRQRGVI